MGQAVQRRTRKASNDELRLELGGERLHVLLSATVQAGARAIRVRLREVSHTGARVEAAVLPPVGTPVRFVRGEIDVAARVSWTGRHSFELLFHEAIDERALFVAVGGRRARPGPIVRRPLFPDDNYVGFTSFDDDDENSLPLSKN